jgi:hypothetical protein
MISTPIDKHGRPSFHFDLTGEEFCSIGMVVVQWAYLEHAVFERTVQLAQRYRLPVPENALSTSFSRRLRALREFANTVIKREATKKHFANLVSRIARAEGYRHRVAHGLWSYNPRRLEQLWSLSYRRSNVEPFNVKKLTDFADLIGELSFELMRPGGWRFSLIITRDKKTGSWYGGGIPRSMLISNPQFSKTATGNSAKSIHTVEGEVER